MTAKKRYDALTGYRSEYLNQADVSARLTLPYLIRDEEQFRGATRDLKTPWQSIGAKGVVTLASKLMLALMPIQTSFFKLQLDESQLGELPPDVSTEMDLAFAKIERNILDAIAASDDRVVIHQALKHLVVAGNALIFMDKEGLKLYPLNRYVIDRDGSGNVIEIVTKEKIAKKLLADVIPDYEPPMQGLDEDREEDCDVYTHVKRENNRFVWHQEVFDKIIPQSRGKSPVKTNPWIPLRFNTVDGEAYGRGRVEEFVGDLKSLEALSQAIVEGSAAAAKVDFVVSPSSTTKPQTLAAAGNGAIVQGRPDDIGVVQVGKSADFATAYQMIGQLEKRLSEAFLILSVRQSERTTAEEVRMTQMELEQQLGGLFSLLTVEFLVPYLDRKLSVFEKTGQIPKLPRDIVNPTIVAGVNALGRGQDREALGSFLGTIAQTMGPEAITTYINPEEVIKRLAASEGIDILNLVKSMQEVEGKEQQAQEQAMAVEQGKIQAQMAGAPMNDPSKNPQLQKELDGQANPQPPS